MWNRKQAKLIDEKASPWFRFLRKTQAEQEENRRRAEAEAERRRLGDWMTIVNAPPATMGSGLLYTPKIAWTEPAEVRSVPGPILGLRGWALNWSQMVLEPLSWTGNWEPGGAVKADNFPGPESGYWALRFSEDIPRSANIAGIVAIWGRVHAHERGWRAEYAYPVAIWPRHPKKVFGPPDMPGFPRPKRTHEWLETVAAKYGIEWLERAPWEVAA